jgi:hypothetical protein
MWLFRLWRKGVGEHFPSNEAVLVRGGGVWRRENVGMSSKNLGENPRHRKSKGSWATQIDPGLVGPKARPKGVVDG